MKTKADTQLRELQLLDELYLETGNGEYHRIRDNRMEEIIEARDFRKLLHLASVSLQEYNSFGQYEKDVIDEEIFDTLFNKLEEMVESHSLL